MDRLPTGTTMALGGAIHGDAALRVRSVVSVRRPGEGQCPRVSRLRPDHAPRRTRDLVGGEAGAKAKGLMQVEGKEYVVQDGDVMHFRTSA